MRAQQAQVAWRPAQVVAARYLVLPDHAGGDQAREMAMDLAGRQAHILSECGQRGRPICFSQCKKHRKSSLKRLDTSRPSRLGTFIVRVI